MGPVGRVPPQLLRAWGPSPFGPPNFYDWLCRFFRWNYLIRGRFMACTLKWNFKFNILRLFVVSMINADFPSVTQHLAWFSRIGMAGHAITRSLRILTFFLSHKKLDEFDEMCGQSVKNDCNAPSKIKTIFPRYARRSISANHRLSRQHNKSLHCQQ